MRELPVAFFRHVAWQNQDKKYKHEKSINLVYDHTRTHALQAAKILDTKKIRKHTEVIIVGLEYHHVRCASVTWLPTMTTG